LKHIVKWKNLRKCLIIIDIELDIVKSIPLEGSEWSIRQPKSVWFEALFLVLNDEGMDKIRTFKAEWQSELRHLQQIEVIANIGLDGKKSLHTPRPLIFGSLCSVGRLHFVR